MQEGGHFCETPPPYLDQYGKKGENLYLMWLEVSLGRQIIAERRRKNDEVKTDFEPVMRSYELCLVIGWTRNPNVNT
jgi:hypothetical protein